MKFSRRTLSLSGLLLAFLAVVVAACSDETNPALPPVEPPPTGEPNLSALRCMAHVREESITCRPPQPKAGGALASTIEFDGFNGQWVKLTSTNVNYNSGTEIFSADVTLQNLIGQALGTHTGTDVDSIKVFFVYGPLVKSGAGTASVRNHDGLGTFVESGTPYFGYFEKLDSGQVSQSKLWQWDISATVDSFYFEVAIHAPVQFPHGWINLSPGDTLLRLGQTVSFTPTLRDPLGEVQAGAVAWSSSDPAVATVDASGLVTAVGVGTADITATNVWGSGALTRTGKRKVTVNTAPLAQRDSFQAIANVPIAIPLTALTANDNSSDAGQALTVIADSAAGANAGGFRKVVGDSLFYHSPAGHLGLDSVAYVVNDGAERDTAYVIFNVTSRVWYVEHGADAGNGHSNDPFPTLAEAAAAAADNEQIFVRFGDGSSGASADSAHLKPGQTVTGQGIATPIFASLNGRQVRLLAPGNTPKVARSGSGSTIYLSAGNNVLQGIQVESTSGAAIRGDGFGTFTGSSLRIVAAGPALDLKTGMLALDVDSLVSSGSTGAGVNLSGVGGTLAVKKGGITGAAGGAFLVDGGNVRVVYEGDITQGANAPLLGVSGGHVDSLTFKTGTLAATNGTGLQFSNADGTYLFQGSTTLNGGDAGIDVLAGSDGRFVFGSGVSVTSPTGTAFRVDGSAPRLTFAGTLLRKSAGLLVDISNVATDSITFTGTLADSAGSGIRLAAAGGVVEFLGTTSLAGGDAGVDVESGSTGIFTFETGFSIQSPSGTAFRVSGSAPAITYKGNITQATAGARLVDVTSLSGGSVAFGTGSLWATGGTGILLNDVDGMVAFNGSTVLSGGDAGIDAVGGSAGTVTFASTAAVLNPSGEAITVIGNAAPFAFTYSGLVEKTSGTGRGIVVESNTGGTIQFNGADKRKRFSTGASAAVDLNNNGAATIVFAGDSLQITTTTAAGFSATGGGKVQVTGAHNTVATTGGVGVRLDGVSIVGGGVVFERVDVSGGTTNGIVLNGTASGSTNGFLVTGVSTPGSGGVIATTGHAVSLTNALAAELRFMNLTAGGANSPVFGGTFGVLTINGVNATSAGGPALNLTTGGVRGTFASLIANASASSGILLNGVDSTFVAEAGSIQNAADPGVAVLGGTVGFTYRGTLSQAVNQKPLVYVNGGHNGALVFETGALNATAGGGLRFENADGSYAFRGATTLGADSAGIDILAGTDATNGSQGSFAFGTGVSIANTAGTGFSLAGSAPTVVFRGSVTKTGIAAGRLVDVAGQKGGSVEFAVGTLSSTSTAGTGIQLSGATGTMKFNGTTTLSGGDAGIDVLGSSTGTITFAADSGTAAVTNPSGIAISVASSAPVFTYAGSFTKNNNSATGIQVQNNTGGTISFTGATKTLSTGSANAVDLVNNTGATINFQGGNLAITTTSGRGFNATGGGGVQVTGVNNTVNSTGGGTAVHIQNTNIVGTGVSFYSVAASGGGTHGILLSNTGNTNGFQVVGDGASDVASTTRGRITAKSGGGSIAPGSGGTITGKSTAAVVVSNATSVVLRNMVLQNNGGDGISAATVSGLTLDNMRITGQTTRHGLHANGVSALSVLHSEFLSNATDASVAGPDIWNVRLDNVTGSSSVQASLLQNSYEYVLGIFNNAGTLNLAVNNNTITGATNGNGVNVDVAGSANVTTTFQADSIAGSSSHGIQAGTQATTAATLNVTVNNTAFTDQFVGVTVAHGSSGANTFSVTNNRFQRHGSVVINVNRLGADALGFTSFGLFSGTISGNTIGTAGVANSGSDAGDGIDVKTNGNGGITRVAILNNTIREYGQHGIALLPRDATSGHTLEARVQGNTITNPEPAISLDGINTTLGALNTDKVTVCLNITGNTVTNAVRNGLRVRSSGLPAPVVALQLQGWDGVTAPATYFANNNSVTGAGGNTSFSNTNGTTTAVSSCTTP